jgi:hypothetical protein
VGITGSLWGNVSVKLPVIFTTGLVLAGLIWKVAEKVEDVLSAETKIQIAVWLLDRKSAANMIRTWPETFRNVFIAIFGERFFSWKCFLRSCVYSACASLIMSVLICLDTWRIYRAFAPPAWRNGVFAVWITFIVIFITNAAPDYASLGETRFILGFLSQGGGSGLLCLFWFVTLASVSFFHIS